MKCLKDIISHTVSSKITLFSIIIIGILIASVGILRNYLVSIIVAKQDTKYIYIYIGFTILSYILYILKYKFVNNQIIKSTKILFEKFINKFFEIDILHSEKYNKTILSDLNESLYSFTYISHDIYVNFVKQIFTALIATCIFIYHIPWISFVIFGTIIVTCILIKYLLKLLDNQWNKYWNEYNKFNKLFQDIMLNIWNIKYNSIQLLVKRLLKKQLKKRFKEYKKWLDYKILSYEGPDIVFFIVVISLLIAIVKNKKINITLRVFFILQSFRIWKEYHNISASIVNIFQDSKYVEKICPIWLLKPQLNSGKNIDKISLLEFKNVSYSYKKNKNVLENINFKLNEGKSLSLNGKSGSGKTTIIHLICRLYDLDKNNGLININNSNINSIELNSLRKYISIVPQRIMVFNFSVKDNIILDADYDEKKLNKLLKMLDIYNYKNKNANDLSEGQKQRVIIGRCLYQDDKSVFIFDEYLSALDKKNSDRIHKYVLKFLKKNKKIGIFISHDPKKQYLSDYILNL